MSCGGVGGGTSDGGGAGGRVVSSLKRNLVFGSFYWLRRRVGEGVSHTSKPSFEHQQKSLRKAVFNALIRQAKFALKSALGKTRFAFENQPAQAIRRRLRFRRRPDRLESPPPLSQAVRRSGRNGALPCRSDDARMARRPGSR